MNLLFYLLPAVMNITSGLFFFVSAKRMADSGASSYLVALTMTTWATFYAVTSWAAGYILTKRNATRVLLLSQAILLGALTGLACTASLPLQFLWLVGTGVGDALFFTAFQVVIKLFGKEEKALEDMVRNSAVYTFSWSIGLAFGPFTAAFVWGLFDARSGWRYCYLIAILIILFVTAGILTLAQKVRHRLADGAPPDALPADAQASGGQPKLPDLMVAGWLLQGLGYIVVAMMRTYLPDYCTRELAMGTFHQGLVMGLVSFAQAFAGLACCKARRWPYRPWTVGGVSLVAAAAFLLFACSAAWTLYAMAAILLGIFSGVMCFTATFHALVNPTKSAKYVSVNETLVGVGSVVAPLLGGFLASHCGVRSPFFACMLCLVLCALLYGCFTWRTRRLGDERSATCAGAVPRQ
ncbi:MAG: MFS transporter [Victivallales bacterium]|nr:MFS transporter [Victivallales bacterium]